MVKNRKINSFNYYLFIYKYDEWLCFYVFYDDDYFVIIDIYIKYSIFCYLKKIWVLFKLGNWDNKEKKVKYYK